MSELAHDWQVTTAEARDIQARLCSRVIRRDALGKVRFVAGTDVAFEADGKITRGAVAVLRFPELELYEYAIARRSTSFPYVPGLLSFREVPVVLEALDGLDCTPDLILCDGQGLAHPRRFGLACHLGVLTGIPSIGVAKSRLLGEHEELPFKKGSHVSLEHKGEVVGRVLRTRDGVRPVYVSTGHKISLPTASRYVMRCLTRYRLPETTRWAIV